MGSKEQRLLSNFRIEIDSIKKMMLEDSENSIQNLIYNLNWDDTVYRTFNKGLAIMWKKKQQDKLPGTLIEYIHKAHLSLILAVLRKIFEPPKKGTRSVNSIPTIIKKIKDNIGLWTRENYVCYDGVPYDEKDTDDWKTRLIIKSRHSRFDNMCTNKANRSKKDRPSIEIINSLEKMAKLDETLEKFVNSFLFHAAGSSSRPNEDDIFNKTTLMQIQTHMKRAVWILLQLCKIVDSLVLTELATPQFEQLKAWDNSIFDEEVRDELENYWQERAGLWREWTNKYWQTDEIYISPNKTYAGE